MDTSKNYGEKVEYSENENLEFPDFTLRFIGERKEDAPQYAGKFFVFYDFEITSDDEKKTISWSSGTGEIAPTAFDFKGKDFLLEMSISNILGQLTEDEIIIWTKDLYDSELQKRQ